MLLLVIDPVVYNTQIQTDNMLTEGPKSNIKVVSHDIQVVLNIRLYNLLLGLIIACKIVCKL
jgi:hypothetical protein